MPIPNHEVPMHLLPDGWRRIRADFQFYKPDANLESIPDVWKLGGPTLIDDGRWSPPTDPIEAMFYVQQKVQNGKNKLPKEPSASRHIGAFVVTAPWLDIQSRGIFGNNYDEQFLTPTVTVYPHADRIEAALIDTVSPIARHIETALLDMSDYGPGIGLPKIRKQVLHDFSLNGYPLYHDDEFALVGGGVVNALKLVQYTLQKSLSEDTLRTNGLVMLDMRQSEIFDETDLELVSKGITQETYWSLVIKDSANFDAKTRNTVAHLLHLYPRLVITDVVTDHFDASQDHLALDHNYGDRVIMIDGTPLAKASGLSAVFADPNIIGPLRTFYTRTYGPPPSTQSNLRLLLSDSILKHRIAQLNDGDFDSLITPSHQMLFNYIKILKNLTQAVDNTGKSSEIYYQRAREIVRNILGNLEDKLDKRYDPMLPGADNGVVLMGGGRQGNVESLMYLRKKHNVKKALVIGPGWTYKDVRHLMEDLAREGIEDMEIIIEPEGYKMDGEIDVEMMEGRMSQIQGSLGESEQFAVFGASGPNNPTGIVPSEESQKQYYRAAVKYNAIAFLDDCAYIECVEPSMRHTYAQIHQNEENKIPILFTIATLSKGITSMPSGRLVYIACNDTKFRTWAKERREIDPDGFNSLSILLADAILTDQNLIDELEAFLVQDIKLRRDPTEKLFQDRDIKFLPSQHYYSMAEVFHVDENPWVLSDILATYYRAGAIPALMLSGFTKDDDVSKYKWRNWVRFALGGNLPVVKATGEPDYELPSREVAYWLDSLEDLRKRIIIEGGNIEAVKAKLQEENNAKIKETKAKKL